MLGVNAIKDTLNVVLLPAHLTTTHDRDIYHSSFLSSLQATMVEYELLAPQASYQTTKVVLAAKHVDVDLKVKLGQSPEALTALLPTAKSLILRIIPGTTTTWSW